MTDRSSEWLTEPQAQDTTAEGNAAQGYGVAPSQAAQAINDAPASGIPPNAGMHSPQVGADMSAQWQDTQAINAHPALRGLATQGPAQWAVARDDTQALLHTSLLMDAFPNGLTTPFHDIWNSAVGFLQSQKEYYQAQSQVPQVGDIGGALKRELAFPGEAVNVASAPFSVAISPATSPAARLLAQIPTTQPMTYEQRLEQANKVIGTALLGLGPGGAKVGEMPALGAHPATDAGRAEVAVQDAQHVAALQESIVQGQVLGRSPQVMNDFLAQWPEGTVRVDPNKLVELAAQGHVPFPNMVDDTISALRTGSPLDVPMSRYLTETAGKPFADELNSASVFRDGGVSVEEGKAGSEELGSPEVRPSPAEEAGVMRPGGVGAERVGAESFTPMEQARVEALVAERARAIEQALKSSYLQPLFADAKAIGMSDAQFARYSEALGEVQRRALQGAVEQAQAQVRRERTPEWKAEVASNVEKLRPQIEAQPIVRAMKQLSETGFKLDRGDVESFFPEPASRLPKGILKHGGNHPDAAADMLGYPSGAQLVSDLADLQSAIEASGAKNLRGYVELQARGGAEAAAADRLGFDISPEAIRDEAARLVNGPLRTDLLSEELKALSGAGGGRFDRGEMEALASNAFNDLTVREAANPRKMMEQVYRHGVKAERALLKGDIASAFKAKQDQFIQHLMAREAYDFAKEFKRADKKLSEYAKANAGPGMDPQVGALVQQATRDLGYELHRDSAELERFIANGPYKSVPGLVEHIDSTGIPMEYVAPPEDLAHVNGELPPHMRVSDFRDYYDMVKGLAKFGRDARKVDVANVERALDDVANEVMNNGERLGVKYTPQQLHDYRSNWFKRMGSRMQTLFVSNLRPEVYLHMLDGDRQGPLMQGVVNPLMKGKFLETDLIDAWSKAMKGVDQSGKLYRSMGVKLPESPEFMKAQTALGAVQVIQTHGDLRAALLHLGSVSARTKLLEGFGWDHPNAIGPFHGEMQVQWLLDHATQEDWDFVREFWKQNDTLFKRADEMYGRVRGYGLKEDPAIPVDTQRFGTIPGGHVHIQYNWSLARKMRLAESAEDATMGLTGAEEPSVLTALDSRYPASGLPSSGYRVERTGFTAPVQLDYRYLSSGVAQMIHDIAYREPLIQAQKVLTDPRVEAALESTLGPEYQRQVLPWLNYIAKQRLAFDPATDDLAAGIRSLASNVSFAKVAFNPNSVLKHSGVGAMHMLTEIGDPKVMAQAASDLFGPKGATWRDFVDMHSGEVRGLKWNIDTTLQDAMIKDAVTGGALARYRELGYASFTMAKRLESQVTWLSKFRQEVARSGDFDGAVNVADKAVRDTQGAGSAVDLAPALRHGQTWQGELGRALTGFVMGFRNTAPNRLFTIQRQLELADRLAKGGDKASANELRVKAVGGAAGFVVFAAAILALYESYFRGEGKPFEHFAWGLADNTFGSMVGASIIENMAHYAQHGGGDDIMSSTVHDLMASGDFKNHRWLATALAAAGEFSGTWTASMSRALQAGIDQASGQISRTKSLAPEDAGVIPFAQRALLGRPPKAQGSTRFKPYNWKRGTQ